MVKMRYSCHGSLFALCGVVVIGFTPSIVVAQSLISEEAQAAYDAAEALLADEKYDEAIASYSEAIKIDESAADMFAEAYRGRGDAYAALDDFQSALKDYAQAIQRNESLPGAFNGQGEVYLKANAITEALNAFSKAVEGDRDNPKYVANQGRAMARVGMAPQALKVLNRAIELDATNPEAFTGRAQAYSLLQDFESAYADIDTAIELDPTNYETYYAAGTLRMQGKDHRGAIEAFGRAMENYSPKHPFDLPYVDPLLGSALAYIELGKEGASIEEKTAAYEAAVAECDKSLEIVTEMQLQRAIALFNRGVALRLLGNYGDSIKSFTDAIQFNPEFGEAYFRRGIVWHYLGEDGLAAGDFEQASSIAFEDVRPLLWLGFAEMSQENYLEAIRAYGAAINQDERYTLAHVNRGLAYMQIEEYEKAVRDFNGAIRLEPTEAHHFYKRGSAQVFLGDYQAAGVSYSTAIALDPNFVDAYDRLAECGDALGRTDLAAEARKQAKALETGETTDIAPPEELPVE